MYGVMGQYLVNVYGYCVGVEVDQCFILIVVIQFVEIGVGKIYYQYQQLVWIVQGNDLCKMFFDVVIVQQFMFGEDYNVLYFCYYMYINVVIDIFVCRGKIFVIFNGGQDDGI